MPSQSASTLLCGNIYTSVPACTVCVCVCVCACLGGECGVGRRPRRLIRTANGPEVLGTCSRKFSGHALSVVLTQNTCSHMHAHLLLQCGRVHTQSCTHVCPIRAASTSTEQGSPSPTRHRTAGGRTGDGGGAGAGGARGKLSEATSATALSHDSLFGSARELERHMQVCAEQCF